MFEKLPRFGFGERWIEENKEGQKLNLMARGVWVRNR